MEKVRIYEIPKCRMVSSKCGMFGDGKLEKFDQWFSKLPKSMFPKDFLFFDKKKEGFVWYHMYEENMNVPDDFDLIEFQGGLYAVASGIDGENNTRAIQTIKHFIKNSDCFIEDESRQYLGNVITPPAAEKVMGFVQMDYYVPIKSK